MKPNNLDKLRKKRLGDIPQEASENIQAPELAPRDNRFTGRTQQLGLKVKPEFAKKLKTMALNEETFIVEILEKALDCYERERKR